MFPAWRISDPNDDECDDDLHINDDIENEDDERTGRRPAGAMIAKNPDRKSKLRAATKNFNTGREFKVETRAPPQQGSGATSPV